MKKAQKAVCALLTALLVTSSVTVAMAAPAGKTDIPLKAVENALTRVVFTDGSQTDYVGVLDAARLEEWSGVERVASYSTSYNGEEMLSVTLNGIIADNGSVGASSEVRNGYYAVTFELPQSNKEVF